MKKSLSPVNYLIRFIVPIIALQVVLFTHWKLEGIAVLLIFININLMIFLDSYLDN